MSEVAEYVAAPVLPVLTPSPRRAATPKSLERTFGRLIAPVVKLGHLPRAVLARRVVTGATKLETELRNISDGAMIARAAAAGRELRHRPGYRSFTHAAALAREAVHRETGLRLNDRQIQGAALIWAGRIVEMDTGEGKTLTAVAAAAAAALAGQRVHVITANDYLAARDQELTAPVYARLGVKSALVTRKTPQDDRRERYQAPIVYVSNAEVTFDHLRDRTERARPSLLARIIDADGAGGALRLPRLDVAIVDEADSVMVDDGRTPLVLAGQGDPLYNAAECRSALDISAKLERGTHYRLQGGDRSVTLTQAGSDAARHAAEPLGHRWRSAAFREEAIRQAVSACNLFKRDRDYVLRDDKVMIVDENTGRIFEDRSWSMGLHQMIEVKEGLEPSPETVPQGRLTYQAFFSRYGVVGGMTGTVAEAATELYAIYGLRTARIRPLRRSRRIYLPDRVFLDQAARDRAVVARVNAVRNEGRAVLVGTAGIGSSQALATLLSKDGIPCEVLNAEEEAAEARIVAKAGRAGQVTIATNMAGRGTDIRPDRSVLEAGGLHVILTERHEARRIDRQLQGRTARQGDPGSCETLLSLEDRILTLSWQGSLLHWLTSCARALPALRAPLMRLAQVRVERRYSRQRWALFVSEHRLDDVLAISGMRE